MKRAQLIKALASTLGSLSVAMDEQQRAANGQFGSGGGSSSKKQKTNTGAHGGFAGAAGGKTQNASSKPEGGTRSYTANGQRVATYKNGKLTVNASKVNPDFKAATESKTFNTMEEAKSYIKQNFHKLAGPATNAAGGTGGGKGSGPASGPGRRKLGERLASNASANSKR